MTLGCAPWGQAKELQRPLSDDVLKIILRDRNEAQRGPVLSCDNAFLATTRCAGRMANVLA